MSQRIRLGNLVWIASCRRLKLIFVLILLIWSFVFETVSWDRLRVTFLSMISTFLLLKCNREIFSLSLYLLNLCYSCKTTVTHYLIVFFVYSIGIYISFRLPKILIVFIYYCCWTLFYRSSIAIDRYWGSSWSLHVRYERLIFMLSDPYIFRRLK